MPTQSPAAPMCQRCHVPDKTSLSPAVLTSGELDRRRVKLYMLLTELRADKRRTAGIKLSSFPCAMRYFGTDPLEFGQRLQ
jgi:hypothetical protein